ncbi:MAG: ATP-binding protein [Nocardioidaceae bacterium]|nr:ATP-binding protein [Nocardioidaceae bacterium]
MSAMGAVLLEGPKACGKTASASRLAKTVVRLDEDANARAAVRVNAQALFDQPTPILFDEWQVEPDLWNRVRRQVDDRGERGLYLLTGSATPRDDAARHSGAGRIGTLRMRPMSLHESGHSNGDVSIAALFAGEPSLARDNGLTVPDLMERVVVGGWPGLLDSSEADARTWLADYLRQIAEVDLPAAGPRRNPRNIARLFASLGRSVGQAVKLTEIAKDVGGDRGAVASETLTGYLDALDRLMLIDNSEAWQPHMRSTTRLRNAPVRYFVDPSIGTAALGVGSGDLLADLNAAGFHFEALVVRDLRIYAQPLGGVVDSWRDANGREVDAVISLPDGRWGAFEIKLDADAADKAATSLLRFAQSVDTTRHGDPTVLGVITSTGYAGVRSDGVHVIPITALGP